MRAFLALPVLPPAGAPLASSIESLRQRVGGVRWVDTATTHLTLHFFAELPPDRVEAVSRAVGDAGAVVAPFTLRLGGIGSFPGRPRARVLWLGLVEESPALLRLAELVRLAVAGCGFEVDGRPFRPHVTLGRPGPRFDVPAWRRELAMPLQLPAFTADRLVLYESRGGLHHVRERIPLGGRRAGSPVLATADRP